MTNCDLTHTNETATPRKAPCPVNGLSYSRVKVKTILHQVKKPWQLNLLNQNYFFCDDPNCDVVYFGEDKSVLVRSDLRISVGQKSQDREKTICYCFDVQFSDLDVDKVRARAFVVEQTKNGSCDCELRNPSGKCCLKNFPGISN
ncbi:MAG: hypothetical protein V3R49_02975 [Gammaproteobacteria bacterium]